MLVLKSYSTQPSSVRGSMSHPCSCCADTDKTRRKIATVRIKRKRVIGRGEISRMNRNCQAQDSAAEKLFSNQSGQNCTGMRRGVTGVRRREGWNMNCCSVDILCPRNEQLGAPMPQEAAGSGVG